MNQTVRELDQELAEWAGSLPANVRHATEDRKNTKMLASCLTAFFVYYSAIINLRTCNSPSPLFWICFFIDLVLADIFGGMQIDHSSPTLTHRSMTHHL